MSLAPANTQPLVLRAHSFAAPAGVVMVRAGQSLRAMLQEANGELELDETLSVRIGGYDVPAAMWARVRPKAGTAIHVTRNGLAGGNVWRTVALIVLMVAVLYITGGGAAAGGWFTAGSMSANVLAAGVYMLGTLAINALIPPPSPGVGGGTEGRMNMLTGSQNGINPYGEIPFVMGEARYFPPHAVMPYSESMGTESYQRLMFDLGLGIEADDVSDIRIGETPLADYEGVQYEITTTPTLYTDDVSEEGVSATMRDGDVVERTTAAGIDEISLDIVFPSGLFETSEEGDRWYANVFFDIEYRLAGTSDPWVRVSSSARRSSLGYISNPEYTSNPLFQTNPFFCRREDRKPFAASIGWDVPTGQYEVRVTRGVSEWDRPEGSRVGEECQWTLLRSITSANPSRTGTTKLCMRIKASEQLNGTLQSLSCLVKRKIRVYDRDTGIWAAPAHNLNPAWVYHWLLTECPAFSTHVPASKVDLDAIADFADFCTLHGFETRAVVDARTTAAALIDEQLASALGARGHRNGKYTVIFDAGETLPSMTFTPMETHGFAVSRIFTRLPHALKVRFRNPAANWEPDEIMVLDDGYSFRGVDARGVASALPAPTVFETLELRFCGSAEQAWRVGRHHFAQAKFRPSTYAFGSDIAGLSVIRGDVVDVAHDVTDWGTGWGRVLSLVGTTLTLDESIACPAGASYSVQFRTVNPATGAIEAQAIACTPHSVETTTFYLASAPVGVSAGDAAILGQTESVTTKLLATGVTYGADLATSFVGVAYDARVAPYWADPPPAIVSEITGATYTDAPDPPVVTVTVSDPINDTPDDAGITSPEVFINTTRPNQYADLVSWQVR